MADFNYVLKEIQIPKEGSPGSKVSIKIGIENATAEISKVYLSVPLGGVYEVFTKKGDTLFTLDYYIPYEAPDGIYDVSVWAVSKNNERGSVADFKFRIN